MAIKSFKVGSVNMKKDKTGSTVALGNKSKDPRFATNVRVIVTNSNGDVLADKMNPYLVVKDPRERIDSKTGAGLTEEQLAKIPEFILKELSIVTED